TIGSLWLFLKLKDAPGQGATAAEDPADLGWSSQPQAALPSPARYIAAGGGLEPSSTQISLQQDMEQLRRALGAEQGAVLFAGGTGRFGVQLDAPPGASADPFRQRFGDVMSA